MSQSKLRIGLLGVAGISSKAAVAISSPDSGCVVSAVGSRNLEKAKNFIKEFFQDDFTVQAFGGETGYDDLLKSDAIDAVYIPLPTAIKKRWVVKALQSKKHVVLEKPAALNANDYKEMLDAAYASKKFILDGTMYPHHNRTADILELIARADSKVGKIDRIECNFSFMGGDGFDDSNIRASKAGDPQGCIGDLGWYCIRFGLMVFGKLGSAVKSAKVVDFTSNKHGVPVDTTCVVRFENDKILWFHCGFRTGFRQRFEICGSKKFLSMDDLVLPTDHPTFTLTSSGLTKYDLITCHEKEVVETKPGPVHEVCLWNKFGKICSALDNDSSGAAGGKWAGNGDLVAEANEWAAISLTNQRVVDALMQSVERDCVSVDL